MKDEIRKVVQALDKKHPGLVVTKVVDYDNSYYIVEAPESTDEPDMNDPWYAVDKDTLKVFTFTPTADLPKFSKALNTRVVYDITKDGADTFEEAVKHFLQSDKADTLAHHGILGMKWGHKNGPPYPLDESDHSASEKKAGWKSSVSGGSSLSKGELLLIKGTMAGQQHPAIRGGQIAQGKTPVYKKINEAGSRLKSKAGAAQKAVENWYNRPDGLTGEAQEQRRLASVDAQRKYSKALTKEVDDMLGDGNWGPQDRLAVRRAISSAANYQGMMETYDIKRGDEKQTDLGYWACQMNYLETEAEPDRRK